MLLWLATSLLLFCTLQSFTPYGEKIWALLSFRTQENTLRKVAMRFREFEDTLMAGLVPPPENWQTLSALPKPWGILSVEILGELRSHGSSLLPTLKRLRELATEHHQSLTEARVQSAQVLVQITVCIVLVPILGIILYLLLPELEKLALLWCAICFFSAFISTIGALWLIHLGHIAQWGGLATSQWHWILYTQCAGEKFLALIRSGTPADIAWTKICTFIAQQCAEDLARIWGYSIWEETEKVHENKATQIFQIFGNSMKKSIQVSLLEGKPCLNRIESALSTFRQDVQSQVKKELHLLSTRALKPLFICVAPALFALIGCGMWLATQEGLISNEFF